MSCEHDVVEVNCLNEELDLCLLNELFLCHVLCDLLWIWFNAHNNCIKDIPVASQNTLLEYKNVILVGGENSIKIVSIRTFDIIKDIQNKKVFCIHSLMIIKDICVIGYNTKIQCMNLKEYEILNIDDKNNLALGGMKQLDENSFISTIKNEEIVVWKY